MLLSVVVHLVPAALMDGEVVGRAESVGTGTRATVRDLEDLLAFLRQEAEALDAIGSDGATATDVPDGGDG